MDDISLVNKSRKHELVRKLHREGKSYRRIASIAHISLRDIKPLIENDRGNFRSTMDVMRSRDDPYKHFNKLKNNVKAYKLLLQGMSLLEIAITLNLSYMEIKKYWLEYLQLKKMHKLYKLYVNYNGKIGNILYINDFIFRNKIDKKNISYVLKIADNVTTLEQIYSYLVESVTRETKVNNYYGNIENRSQKNFKIEQLIRWIFIIDMKI